MKNNKDRNSVDLFSDYGLDERQKAISAELGFKGFKTLFNVVVIISILWAAVYGSRPDISIPLGIVFSSYLIAAVICRCVYAAKAAENGLINGITAFSFTTGGIIKGVVYIVLAVILFLIRGSFYMNNEFLSVMLIIAAIEEFFLCFCGKKNFKVIDSMNEDDEEE